MVAGTRLFDPAEVFVELLLRVEGGPVDGREHRAARVAAPVGAREVGEPERLDAPRARAVRAAAEVDERAVAVERDGLDALVAHEVLDQLDLVVLALGPEALERLLDGEVGALEGLVGADVLPHPFLDAR